MIYNNWRKECIHLVMYISPTNRPVHLLTAGLITGQAATRGLSPMSQSTPAQEAGEFYDCNICLAQQFVFYVSLLLHSPVFCEPYCKRALHALTYAHIYLHRSIPRLEPGVYPFSKKARRFTLDHTFPNKIRRFALETVVSKKNQVLARGFCELGLTLDTATTMG